VGRSRKVSKCRVLNYHEITPECKVRRPSFYVSEEKAFEAKHFLTA
jgi:hypothetical protein